MENPNNSQPSDYEFSDKEKMIATELSERANQSDNPDWWFILYEAAIDEGENHLSAMKLADDAIKLQPDSATDLHQFISELIDGDH